MRRLTFLILCGIALPLTAHAEFALSREDAEWVAGLPVMHVLVDDNFSPFSRWNTVTQTYEGISVELFEKSAAQLGLPYEIVHNPDPWLYKFQQFQTKQVDIVLPVSITPERSAHGLFTTAYYEATYGAIAPAALSRRLERSSDLARWNVGVVELTSIVPYAETIVPPERLFRFKTAKDLYRALREGRVDFALQNSLVFEEERYDQELFDLEDVHSIVEWPRRYAIYFQDTPVNRRLVPLFDKALAGVDIAPLFARYGRGAEDLILRYTDQKHRDDLLVFALVTATALVVLLGLVILNQRRLKETEARYRALSDASFNGIAIHDKAVILECNQGLSDMTGYSREELIGMDGLKLIAPPSVPSVLEHMRTDSTEAYEVIGKRKDGSEFSIAVRGRTAPYKGKSARVTEFIDITERKKAEDAIRTAKQLYDDLVAKIPMGIYLLRSKPDLSFTFEFVSPRMGEILGHTVEELLQDPYNAFHSIDPAERADFEALNLRSLEKVLPFEWTGRAYRGAEQRWFHIASSPELQENGDVLWRGTLNDITETEVAEQKISTLLQEKELLLKEVHHRIKNNMSTVSGLLTLQAATLSDPAAVQALEDAKGRVVSMMVLYDKLYLSTDSQAVSLADFLPSLVDEVLANFPNVGIITHETRAEDLTLDAKTLSSLGIIVNELLTNVMKYAFQGRASGSIRVSASQAGGLVRVSVQDDGRGVPDDFDLTHPTGFGLSLVDMLTQHMKGKLTVQRGEGTTIVLEFPSALP